MFDNYRTFKTTFAGRELTVETGKVCGLANGSCWIRYGESVVMVNVTASPKPRDGVDFFPLSVDYEEKLYSVGKIPGGFLKREGRPSEKAILTSRVVDRPMRPLFPKDMRNDVAIVMTVLAVDPDTQPEILSMIGASVAVTISDIPWNGPIGGISVGLVDGEIVLMPDAEQRAKSDLQLTVASSEKKVVMLTKLTTTQCSRLLWRVTKKSTSPSFLSSRKSRLLSVNPNSNSPLWKLTTTLSTHLWKNSVTRLSMPSIQTTRTSVKQDSSLSRTLFTKSMTNSIPTRLL